VVKVKKIIEKVTYWIFFLFLIYMIYELMRKLFGGSLGFETLVIGLLIANLGYSFYLKGSLNKLDSRLSGHLGWHKGKNNA